MLHGKSRHLAAAAGIIGPLLFALVLVTLSVVQYPFMRSLGWDPLFRPTYFWPSGLALGSLGWLMTITFLVCGALLSLFAWGLRGELKNSSGQIGAAFLFGAGLAMMGLAFTTDRVVTPIPISWHGRLHDLFFMLLGLLLIPAMLLFGLSFRQDYRWRRLWLFSWSAAALAVPTFAVKGIVFYGFLAAILLWNELIAIQLWK
jgi:hypothetical protein